MHGTHDSATSFSMTDMHTMLLAVCDKGLLHEQDTCMQCVKCTCLKDSGLVPKTLVYIAGVESPCVVWSELDQLGFAARRTNWSSEPIVTLLTPLDLKEWHVRDSAGLPCICIPEGLLVILQMVTRLAPLHNGLAIVHNHHEPCVKQKNAVRPAPAIPCQPQHRQATWQTA